MSKTKIQWTEYNWNPFTGCTPESPGCVNCYARKNAKRLEGNPFTDKYKDGFQFRFHPEYLDKPLQWKKPRKIFVNTMSDTFHEDAPLEVIQRIFACIEKCPQHIFQVLTKRAERIAELRPNLPWPDNVWVGVTVENADYLHRLDFLRQVPAKVRFASFEPLLCPIPKINFSGIQWAIVGGESGPKARPMDLDWARDIREQCQRARIPFFFKQVGGKGRDKGGRLLDGQEFNEFPIEAVMARSSDEEPKSETGLSSERDTDEEQSEKYVEIDPAIMYFDRENPVPEQKKIRIKEMNEMPRKSQSKASNEQDTMKKNSHEVQPTLPSKKEHAAPTQSDGGVSMVDESKLKDILDELRQRKTIKNDKGEEIDFTEDLKTSLEKDVQKAYPVLTSALRNIYETGKFFYEVRARQKKNHLWMSFHEIIGMRKSATNNYIRVFDRFGTRLGEVGYLGVSKLQVLARLKDPFAFLEAHRDEVEKGEVRSVTSMVRDEVEAQRQKRDKKSKREPQAVDVGSYRIKLATNGRVLTIQNLNKDLQNKLVEHLKKLLSHEK